MSSKQLMWDLLTSAIDYHHRKWYEYSAEAHEFEECGIVRIFELLDQYAPGKDHARIIKQFYWRDTEAHARPKL